MLYFDGRGLPLKVLLTAGGCPLTVANGMGTDTLAIRAAEGMIFLNCVSGGGLTP